MMKTIGRRLWFCCPKCGEKLLPLMPGAVCSGVLYKCRERSCGWSGEMKIGQ